MLTKSSSATTDYLADWPAHYYELDTAAERGHILDDTKAQGISVPADCCRREMLKRRFFSINSSGTVDAFTHAFTMIQASSSAGVSFFQKKSKKRELESFMKELCLPDFFQYTDKSIEICPEISQHSTAPLPSTEDWQYVLMEEWQDFARRFIAGCAGSKAYSATLFGVMPMNDSKVAQKIAAEILLVTRDYPALFGYEQDFAPFRKVMCDTYCQMIEGGEQYLNEK